MRADSDNHQLSSFSRGSTWSCAAAVLFTCMALACGAAEDGQPTTVLAPAGLFDPNRLLEVQITLAPADYETLRKQQRDLTGQFSAAREGNSKPPTRAYDWFKGDLVIDGISLQQVKIRKRGLLGSASSDRPSFRIELPDRAELGGESRLILHNNNQDPSNLQQYLGYKVLAAAGVPAPRCNLAHVTVNGKSLGVYSHVEAVDKSFLRRHFGSTRGNLYEAAISDFRPGWVNTFEAKNNKQENDRSDLGRLVQALEDQEGVVARVAPLVDIDAYLSFWAGEALIGHWDGYSGDQNNAFVYHDLVSDRFKFIGWGADATFGSPHVFPPFEPPASVMAISRLSRRLYNDPVTREQYREQMRQLLARAWNERELLADVDRLEKLVRPRITIPPVVFDKWMAKVRHFIAERRGQIEAELASPAGPWLYPDRTSRHAERVGSISARFSTVWTTNLITSFAPKDHGQLDLDFYSRKYSTSAAGTRAGISLRHPSWAAVQIVAPVEGVHFPVVLTVAMDRDLLLKGGTIPLDGVRAIGYLTLNDSSQPWFRVLSWHQDGQSSVQVDRAGLEPGDQISGSVTGSISALPWEDFDLHPLGRPAK